MTESIHEDHASVYEIGYLIVSSIPEEKVPAEAEMVKKIITDAGASMLAEEAPRKLKLAYEIRRKTTSGSYDKFDEAYFGWFKFEAASGAVDAVKKSIEAVPSILRMLLITTARENTYLGKRAQAVAAEIGGRRPSTASTDKPAHKSFSVKTATQTDKPDEPVASIEEMDKSIDAMVKGAN